MAKMAKILSLVFVSSTFVGGMALANGGTPSPDAKLPNLVLRPTVCQALLKTGSSLPSINPLTSLRDVQYALRKQRKDPTSKIVDMKYAYMGDKLELDMQKRTSMFFSGTRIEASLARLMMLESDSTQLNPVGTTVGYEFRGEEQIKAAKKMMIEELTTTNAATLKSLRERYPLIRLATIARLGITGYMMAAPILVMNQSGSEIAAAALAPFCYLVAGLNQCGLRSLAKLAFATDLSKQFTTIDKVLAHDAKGFPLSIVSGSSKIRTELHRALMELSESRDLNEDEMQMIVDASEGYMMYMFDETYIERNLWSEVKGMSLREKFDHLITSSQREILSHPEGATRHVFYDSIFYVDPESGQPVWLLYYRAFKDEPVLPKPPRKKPTEQKLETPSWAPGLQPSLVPVPARAGARTGLSGGPQRP